MLQLNLIEALERATAECHPHLADEYSYKAYKIFNALIAEERAMIDGFFSALIGFTFQDLLSWCGGYIQKPMHKKIYIVWSIKDIQTVRPDLDDEEASSVLELLSQQYDTKKDINWDIVKIIADMRYPKL